MRQTNQLVEFSRKQTVAILPRTGHNKNIWVGSLFMTISIVVKCSTFLIKMYVIYLKGNIPIKHIKSRQSRYSCYNNVQVYKHYYNNGPLPEFNRFV